MLRDVQSVSLSGRWWSVCALIEEVLVRVVHIGGPADNCMNESVKWMIRMSVCTSVFSELRLRQC